MSSFQPPANTYINYHNGKPKSVLFDGQEFEFEFVRLSKGSYYCVLIEWTVGDILDPKLVVVHDMKIMFSHDMDRTVAVFVDEEIQKNPFIYRAIGRPKKYTGRWTLTRS